ncbi:FMRFamide receptor-like [Arctopsyche grandis]|uniref:FMRFamide receptor-like n=1 Tax=Arctopsyche grandis TaxID=121162 RepID=UPI00406D7170
MEATTPPAPILEDTLVHQAQASFFSGDDNLTDYLNRTTCLHVYDPSSTDALFEFITNGIMLNVVGLFGIFGNVISMIILSRPQMRSSINYLLIGLARCDTVLIITSSLLFGLPGIYPYTGCLFNYYYLIYPHISPILYPVAMTAQTVSVYLTLTVTLERFVAVCHPLRARSLCTYGRARIYVIVIIIFSLIYNLPRFWEVSCTRYIHHEYNISVYCVEASSLREQSLYITVYIHWLYLVFLYFLPFTSLAILNACIYKQVRRANAERQRLSRLQRREIGLATMLLCVVVVFFLCNILALVSNILEASYDIIQEPLVKTSNLLVTINSSVNFIIYVIFGEKFKRLFLRLFCSHSILAGTGRESPDGATHDDSLISNGENRHSLRLQRQNTSCSRNGGTVKFNGKDRRSLRLTRAPSPGPCVYYPGNTRVTYATSLTVPSEWEGNGNKTTVF